jgi:hypothetical protein
VLETVPTRSADQARWSVKLAEPARTGGAGRVRMEVRPSGAGGSDDSSAQFVTGGRSAEFTFSAGDTAVWFGREQSIVYQTGTTAGTIVLTMEAGGYTDQMTLAISPETVRIDKAAAARSGSNLEVQFSGFDNTRTVSEVSFTFYLRSGQALAGMPVRTPVTGAFEQWWQQSRMGGVFSFKAVFPVSGDAQQIGSVDVEIRNASGTSSTQRLTF